MIATEVICFPLIFIAIFSDIEYSTFLFIVAEIFVLFRQPNLKDWCWNIPLAHWKQKFGYWYPRRNQNNTCFVSSFSFFYFSDIHGKRMVNLTIGKFMTIEYHNNLEGEPWLSHLQEMKISVCIFVLSSSHICTLIEYKKSTWKIWLTF